MQKCNRSKKHLPSLTNSATRRSRMPAAERFFLCAKDGAPIALRSVSHCTMLLFNKEGLIWEKQLFFGFLAFRPAALQFCGC
jgi:hypothetical protein